MRQVIMSAFLTLDGVMQAPGGPEEDPTGGFHFGGWLAPHEDEEVNAFLGQLFAEPFDLLLGRRTYEIFAAYWPYQGGPIAEPFNAATKYVATRSGWPLDWQGSVRLTDAAEDVARLRAEDGPTLLIQGSGTLVRSLHQAGLIDRYHLLTFPVVLGEGRRLFEPGTAASMLKLETAKVTAKGAVIATYAPAGAVECGSFAEREPSQAELARRERWATEE